MMRRLLLPLTAIVLFAMPLSVAAPAHAQASGDQQSARAEMRAGRNLSRREIERRIVPTYERQGYEYLTSEFDGTAHAYRFKFIRDGSVIWVDVDAKTARILRVSR